MDTHAHHIAPHEPTMKQLWLASFTSLLCHMQPEEAIKAADRALELCNEHWRDPDTVTTWQYKHNYPVGYRFELGGFNAAEGLGSRVDRDDSRP